MTRRIIHGDCMDVMAGMPSRSVDFILSARRQTRRAIPIWAAIQTRVFILSSIVAKKLDNYANRVLPRD